MVGVGIDVVDVPRFRTVLERTPGLAMKVFTPGERDYAEARHDPAPSLAVRFAAKEATMKALGVGIGAFGFHDVEVTRDGSGAPRLVVSGAAAALATERGVTGWKVSLSHTCAVATAIVVAE